MVFLIESPNALIPEMGVIFNNIVAWPLAKLGSDKRDDQARAGAMTKLEREQ